MNITVQNLSITEDNTKIFFDINTQPGYKLKEIIIENSKTISLTDNFKTITHLNPLLVINEETEGTEGFSEENDEFLKKLSVTFQLKNTLFFIFITSMHSETSAETTDIFCIYNLFDYIKTFTELTKKITYNNSVPKELLDLSILHSTVKYSIETSNYTKAADYYNKLITYYVE